MMLAICTFGFFVAAIAASTAQDSAPLVYPNAKRVDQVDDYHGTKVADPYRWLEDADSADTHEWVEAENKLTFSYLDKIPYRSAIRERLLKLWNYERFTIPEQRGGRYFFQHNNGLQNQNVVLVAGCSSIPTRCPRTARSLSLLRPSPMMASSWRMAPRPPDQTGRSGTFAMWTRAKTCRTRSGG